MEELGEVIGRTIGITRTSTSTSTTTTITIITTKTIVLVLLLLFLLCCHLLVPKPTPLYNSMVEVQASQFVTERQKKMPIPSHCRISMPFNSSSHSKVHQSLTKTCAKPSCQWSQGKHGKKHAKHKNKTKKRR